jgi:hypothetical protein
MRMHRILISVLAFCLIGLVPFGGSTSANAAEPTATAADKSVTAPVLAKPTRRISFKFKQTNRTYKLYGKVQDAKKKKIYLTRANRKKGKYRNFKTTRTSSTGRYAWTGLRKPGWYKVKVPSTKKWATSVSGWIHVYYV